MYRVKATHIAAILLGAGLIGTGESSAATPDAVFQRFVADRQVHGETVSLRQQVRHDFNRDGKNDVLALIGGHYTGGNGSVQHLVLFVTSNGRLQEADRISRDDLPASGEGYAPILAGIRLEGSNVLLKVGVFQPQDPHCCPSGQATWRLKADGGKIKRVPGR